MKYSIWLIDFSTAIGGADLNDIITHLNLSKKFGLNVRNVILPKKVNIKHLYKNSKTIKIYNIFSCKFLGKPKLLKESLYFYDGIKNMLMLYLLLRSQNRQRMYCFFAKIDPYWIFFAFYLLLYPQFRNKFTVHIHVLPNNFSLLSLLNLSALNLVLKMAKYIVVTEEVNKRELLRRFSSIPSSKIVTLPILPSYFAKKETFIGSSKSKRKYIKKNKNIFFPGQIRTEKGIIDYLHALKKLRTFKEVTFVFAGKYSKKERYIIKPEIEIIKKLLGTHVIFQSDFLSDKEYHYMIKSSNFVILPYKKEYYFSRGSAVIYDCILNQTPFIAPDYGVFSYYVKKYKIGLLYSPGDIDSLAKVIEGAINNEYSFCEGFKKAIEIFNENILKEKYFKAIGGY